MDIVQSPHKLLRNLAYFRLLKRLVILNDVEKLALAKFSDKYKLCVGLEGVEQQDDVLVFKFLEDFYLVPHDLDVLLLLPLLLDGLDSHELPRELATCLVDLPVGALPDQGEDVVVVLLVL
jgi:hypothetical protein